MNPDSPMDQKFIEKLTLVIEQNLQREDFGVEELASELGMSRITLHRRVKAIIKKSVSEFIRETRLKRAHELLYQQEGNVSEIAFRVGFGSVSYFNRCFHNFYGYPPGEVLKGLHSPEKEKPKRTEKKIQISKNIILFAGFFIMIFVTLLLIFRTKHYSFSPKTIAVLPVQVDDTLDGNSVSWITIEIINNLNEIDGISVVNYPLEKKDHRQIAKELQVIYLLNSRVFRTGNEMNLFVELIDVSTDTIWTKKYDDNLNISSIDEVFEIQEKIALNVANWMQIRLSPKETEKFKLQPTDNLEAYNYYLKAIELLSTPGRKRRVIKKAKPLLQKAIQLDSDFSEAYFQLGHIYMDILYYGPSAIVSDLYLDTAKIWLDKALMCDNKNTKALGGLKRYYELKQDYGKAEEVAKRIPVMKEPVKNYNYFLQEHYRAKAEGDPSGIIESFYRYLDKKPFEIKINGAMYHSLMEAFMRFNFPDEAGYFTQRVAAMWWNGSDTIVENFRSYNIEAHRGNFEGAVKLAEQKKDNGNRELMIFTWLKAYYSMRIRDYSKARYYLDEMENMPFGNALEMFSGPHARYLTFPYGYSYLQDGQEKKGCYYLERLLEKYETEISTSYVMAQNLYSYFEAALICSALGKEEKAFNYLHQLLERGAPYYLFVDELKTNPMFDNIRDSKKFRKLVKEYEKKYKAERREIEAVLNKINKDKLLQS